MDEKITYKAQVKHNETHFRNGRIGFWLLDRRPNRIFDFIGRIISKKVPLMKDRCITTLPAEDDEVGDWTVGDAVKITVERVDPVYDEKDAEGDCSD